MSSASTPVTTPKDPPASVRSGSLLDVAALAAGCALLFLITFIPTAYTRFVSVVLAVCLLLVVARWIRDRRIAIDGTVAALALLYVLLGAAFVGWGLIRHNPGATSEAPVFVVWPVVYLILITGIDDDAAFVWLNRTLVIAAIAIGLYALDFIAVNLNWLPQRMFVDLQQDARFGLFHRTYLQFNLNSLASLMFLSPYLIARLADLRSIRSRLDQVLVIAGAVLSVAMTVLALRRALFIVTFGVAPVLIAAYALLLRRDYWRRYTVTLVVVGAGTIVLLAGATVTGHFHPRDYFNVVVSGVDLSGPQAGPKVRSDQLAALTSGWLHSPLIGNGLGAVASVIRSPAQPWAYELSYNALLFKIGIIGVLLYAVGVGWIFWQGVRLVRSSPLSSSAWPVLAGAVGFLVANATNPYLQKFDYLWVLFIPLAYVNYWRLESSRHPTRWDRYLKAVLSRFGMRQGLGESRSLAGRE